MTKAKGTVEKPEKHTDPVVRYLLWSCLETDMGLNGSPGGGFCVFSTKPLVNYKGAGVMQNQRNNAFTIVELLIVIVVIAILAAITVVAYTGVQERANDSTVQSEIAASAKKLEAFNVENGRYPETSDELTATINKFASASYGNYANAIQYCYNKSTQTIALGGVSKSGAGYVYKNGTVVRTSGWSAAANLTVCSSSLAFPMPTGSIAIWRIPSATTWGGANTA
tara:strand:+ start:74 stop:745 length:672 start_codon:yes stop_codon:yes gene_type:complete